MSNECMHGGRHTKRPFQCLDCGRFCSDSWATGWLYTEDGAQQRWGGTCSVHGQWEESVA